MDKFLIFIGASVILVPLFHRLSLGSVLGYLTTGILVGPHGFKLIGGSEGVLHFAELGVVLLLFMIGLEIQPSRLLKMRKELLGLGGLSILFCTTAFGLIGMSFGLEPILAAVVGFSLSLSSTAFAVQTLTEKGQFNTEFGRSCFSILLMQDLVAIPALAIIPVLGNAIGQGPGLSEIALYLPLVLLFLVITSRFLIRPLFRYIAATRAREMFTAITLFVVLGVAALMQKIGLSAALGTFLAGVLLADSEYRHELETDLEPFKGLLMGLFFIAVGMQVSLELIFSQPLFFLVMSILYLGLKTLLLYGAGRLNRLNHENSKLMAINIAQGGEFAFVIFGILTASRMIEPGPVAFLTAVITISMAMSPLLLFLNDKYTLYYSSKNKAVPKYDEIHDEAPQVIIAGYGRFGQIFGRILKAQHVAFVAIEQDPDQIDLVRRFGTQVYYGDASRLDLLKSAGADKAKYFVLAIDNMDVSLETVRTVKKHFPHLKIYARARNRGHAFELLDEGVTNFKRETLDSSANFVGDLLVDLGHAPSDAELMISRFIQHDELMLLEQFKVRKDDKNFVSVTNQSTAQLEAVLRLDNQQSYIKPGLL